MVEDGVHYHAFLVGVDIIGAAFRQGQVAGKPAIQQMCSRHVAQGTAERAAVAVEDTVGEFHCRVIIIGRDDLSASAETVRVVILKVTVHKTAIAAHVSPCTGSGASVPDGEAIPNRIFRIHEMVGLI